MTRPSVQSLFWLTLFSVAMGYLEAVVVVYLRELYYPAGFRFPLVPMRSDLVAIELGREAATLVMLAGVGVLFGRNGAERLAGFLYGFAVWDLGYYLSLKVTLGWPVTLLDWDLLFLIPVPWVGPVLAPCVLSATMIVLAGGLVYRQRGGAVRIRRADWGLLVLGSGVVIASFVGDCARFAEGLAAGCPYVPTEFNWLLFGTGEALLLWAVYRIAVTKTAPLPTGQPLPADGPGEESFSDYWNAL